VASWQVNACAVDCLKCGVCSCLVHTRYLRVQKSCSLYAAANVCATDSKRDPQRTSVLAQPARDTSDPCIHLRPRSLHKFARHNLGKRLYGIMMVLTEFLYLNGSYTWKPKPILLACLHVVRHDPCTLA